MMQPYYQDKRVTIYHGDCRYILPQLQYNLLQVDLVLTDPPYGIGIADWDSFIEPNVWMSLLPQCTTLIFPSIGRMYSYPQPRWVLSWVRDNSTQRNGTGGFNHWEPILVYGGGKFSKDSIRVLDSGGHDFHPSVKPLYLLRWLIAEMDAQVILDPFGGSGTTLRAAKDLNRYSIGIEIEEKYCEIAARRCSQDVMELVWTK